MNATILNHNYKLLWKDSNDKIFVAELRHFVQNEFGGSVETPVGVLVGFVEDRPKFWTVKLIVRNDISYSQTKNKVFVLTKSAYKNELTYYWDKLVDTMIPNMRIDQKLQQDIKMYLINNNICSEPMSFSISEETNKAVEFIGEIDLEELD
ncbi:MAG TPA: hypothetical protein VK796_02875 [Cytophaga sp.]|jgi:hypothetical protein|nr:hypothetical protein [Cytophaga sp.]